MSERVEVGAAGRPRKAEHAEKRKEKLGPGPWELHSPQGARLPPGTIMTVLVGAVSLTRVMHHLISASLDQ